MECQAHLKHLKKLVMILTKERVRQIKEKALRKLRNESGSLFDYL
jgi:DNA-directed RNA polymerase sigma subunit (sigma70/sigma32)